MATVLLLATLEDAKAMEPAKMVPVCEGMEQALH
jgi:hypothetical protein